jgi:hypothetical protein
MIETTRPMSRGRLPVAVGNASINSDGGLYAPITNREVSFPYYPLEVKGYIAEGYGIDSDTSPYKTIGGAVNITYIGYNERTVTSGADYWIYRTPKFQVRVDQDDVINRKWIGVVMTLTADQTTKVYTWTDPGPEVLVSTTPTPQTFTYTFSASDDPTVGSPDYLPPNVTQKEVLGTEYLYSSIVYTSLTPPVSYTNTVTEPDFLNWHMTATTPP